MKFASQTSSLRRTRSAFSLSEVLMVVAIIGVMVGIVVPMLNQNDAVYAARDRRNAQELCSTCAVAQAAGVNFVQDESVIDTVRSIVRGGMSVNGAMRGRVFVVPGLSEEDMVGASKYLRVKDGQLMYSPTDAGSGGGGSGNQQL
ncbi:type II secretion system protein [Prosthecobacter vanneervenii]|uniref:Prepilin-type N-terminal cleavage/methylation domain-containing protein n=1 Tax=Prosthecobacter vanneervenii TaxID=48466 RepID=A0A7W8DLE3_9BACT|nr:prepilin-type N-terminal cleavage/methylation domain-containing protein [Prosthecobacter vanneervenii]MBB5034309.1 prepilin-type N-terminal cleavage/methylation domain-containing protein [Prosthecobacter vanneervenii]